MNLKDIQGRVQQHALETNGMMAQKLQQLMLGTLAQSYIPPKLQTQPYNKMIIKRGDFVIIDPDSYSIVTRETLEEAQEFVNERLSKSIGTLIICTQLEIYESSHTVVLKAP